MNNLLILKLSIHTVKVNGVQQQNVFLCSTEKRSSTSPNFPLLSVLRQLSHCGLRNMT